MEVLAKSDLEDITKTKLRTPNTPYQQDRSMNFIQISDAESFNLNANFYNDQTLVAKRVAKPNDFSNGEIHIETLNRS